MRCDLKGSCVPTVFSLCFGVFSFYNEHLLKPFISVSLEKVCPPEKSREKGHFDALSPKECGVNLENPVGRDLLGKSTKQSYLETLSKVFLNVAS